MQQIVIENSKKIQLFETTLSSADSSFYRLEKQTEENTQDVIQMKSDQVKWFKHVEEQQKKCIESIEQIRRDLAITQPSAPSTNPDDKFTVCKTSNIKVSYARWSAIGEITEKMSASEFVRRVSNLKLDILKIN